MWPVPARTPLFVGSRPLSGPPNLKCGRIQPEFALSRPHLAEANPSLYSLAPRCVELIGGLRENKSCSTGVARMPNTPQGCPKACGGYRRYRLRQGGVGRFSGFSCRSVGRADQLYWRSYWPPAFQVKEQIHRGPGPGRTRPACRPTKCVCHVRRCRVHGLPPLALDVTSVPLGRGVCRCRSG